MRAFMKFKRQKAGTAGIPAIGSDDNPNTTAPTPSANNICRVPAQSSWSSGLKRLALLLQGPSDLNYELWVKDDLTARWYKAQASTALAADTVVYSTNIPAPTNIPTRDAATGDMVKDDFVEVYVRLLDPGAAGNGDYTCALIGDYVN